MTPEELELRKAELEHKQRELDLAAWRAIVEVQMHFNDMSMKVRNFAITLLGAVVGAAAFSLEKPIYFHFWSKEVHVAIVLLLFAVVAWVLVGLMDWAYYHRLLIGAVKKSTEIEDAHKDDVIFGMTKEITKASHWPKGLLGRHKILMFYGLIAALVLLLTVLAHSHLPKQLPSAVPCTVKYVS